MLDHLTPANLSQIIRRCIWAVDTMWVYRIFNAAICNSLNVMRFGAYLFSGSMFVRYL